MLKNEDLNILSTCLSGMIMGFTAYIGSFSTVPILSTLTALLFGTKSLITIFATAFAQLIAGYLHTHSSRTGITISTKIFRGFYIAQPEMKNRRKSNETRQEALKRFFKTNLMNALVLNLMWESFTIYYIIQTILFLRYVEISTRNIIENERKMNETIHLLIPKEIESHFIIINGITRCLAGCCAGMTTGLINHLWQRYQKRSKASYAIFNTNKKKLKLKWKDRKKLLSPYNIENWIKVFVMLAGALFVIFCNIPNISGWHLLDLRKKRLISDLLVINGGWLLLRDSAMLVLKKKEKPPEIRLMVVEPPLIVEEIRTMNDNQSKKLSIVAQTA